MTILCSNPLAHYLAHQPEILEAITKTLRSGRYILGDEVKKFEEEFAKYIGVQYGIGVASGTDALFLSLCACNIGPGDEVITVSHTAVATVAAIDHTGATPVLVDISLDTYNIDPKKIQHAITPRTKAIIVVHLYGLPADMDQILAIAKKSGLYIIEDCAQAHGARYRGRLVGSFGDFGCFSFYPTKNLGALGDGGIIVTKSPELAERVRLFREYGWKKRYISEISGYNSRLDEIQAAVLRLKLRNLDEDNSNRRIIARKYLSQIESDSVVVPQIPKDRESVFHLFVIRTRLRDALQQYLFERGVQTLIHYPVPVHLQPAYDKKCIIPEPLVNTEKVALEVLSLPIYPELSLDDVDYVTDAIANFG